MSRVLIGNGRSYIALLVIVVVGAALRFYHLDYHDFRGDEAFSILFAGNDWAAVFDHLRSGEPHPPLYFALLKVWMTVAGDSEFATRWLSAGAGILLIPLLFACGKALGSTTLGLLAAILVAINPYHIWNGQDVRMYALATTFSTAVLYFGLRFGSREGGPLRRDAIGLAVAAVLAAYTHYVAVVVVATVYAVLVLVIVFSSRRDRRAARLLAASGAISAALYLPWLAVGLPVLGAGYSGNQSSPDLIGAIKAVLTTFTAGDLFRGPVAELMAFVLGGLAFGGAVLLLWKRPAGGVLIFAVTVVPFAALLLASLARPVFSERYLILISPALIVAASAALDPTLAWGAGALGWKRRALYTIVACGAALALLGGTAAALQSYYLDRGGQGSGSWRPFASHIAASAMAVDLVVVNHLDPSFFYYYDKFGGKAETIVQPSRQGQTDVDRDEELSALLPEGGQVWFVPDAVRLWDKEGAVEKWLDRSTVREEVRQIAGMTYVRYRVPAGDPVGAEFGGRLELLRYEIRGEPEALRPGRDLVVDLCWRSLAALDLDLVVSVQLLDENGTLVAQSDGQPASGTAPTSGWRAGESVVDTRTVHLPDREGEYALCTVVYEYPSGERLSVPGGRDNSLLLEWIKVSR